MSFRFLKRFYIIFNVFDKKVYHDNLKIHSQHKVLTPNTNIIFTIYSYFKPYFKRSLIRHITSSVNLSKLFYVKYIFFLNIFRLKV